MESYVAGDLKTGWKDCFPNDEAGLKNHGNSPDFAFGKFGDYYERACCYPMSMSTGGFRRCLADWLVTVRRVARTLLPIAFYSMKTTI